jgi:hypothetical protein
MGILTNIAIDLKPERIAALLSRGARKPFLLSEVQRAVGLAQAWLRPAVVFEWTQVTMPVGETLELHWPDRNFLTALHLGPHASLMAAAETALVSVATIGPEIDAQARGLHQAGESLQAYLVDCVGVLALGETGQAVRRLAEQRAAERDWGVSPSLGPGSLAGWSLTEQPDLCAGLDLAAIGVRLNASGVLLPSKSASGLIGLGPAYRTRKVGSVCRFCMLVASCWRAEHSHGREDNADQ